MPAAVLVILAAVCWGTTGTAQELGPDDVHPLAVGWVRMVVGSAGLAGLAGANRWRRRRADPDSTGADRGRSQDRTRPVVGAGRGWTVAAIVAVALYQVTFFGGVRLAGVALGTAVGIGSAPIWGGLVDGVLTSWRPDPRWAAAAAVAMTGTALVAGQRGEGSDVALGLVLALGAGASYAVYTAALQRAAAGRDPDRTAARVFAWAALAMAPPALAVGVGPLLTGSGLVMAAHLGLVATTLSYALFTRGIAGVTVATAMVLTLAEPLTAVVLGVTVIGEELTAVTAAGMALLFAGVVLATGTRPLRRR